MIKEKDYFDEIISYIKRNLRKGYTKESLKWALVKQGYSTHTIEKAFKQADYELAQQAPELKTKPKITYQIVEPEEYKIKITNKKTPFWKKLFGR